MIRIWPVYNGPSRDSSLSVCALQCTILVQFFRISLWQFIFFHAALFFRCTFFKLHHFYVALFCVVIFSCCPFFRVALFYVLHYFMLHFYTLQCFRSAYLLHFFNAALFACSTLFMLHIFYIGKYWEWTKDRKHNQRTTLQSAL